MKRTCIFLGILLLINSWGVCLPDEIPLSDATQECLDCHRNIHPGIVTDWQQSRHAKQTVAAALKTSELLRRISNNNISEELKANAVGCAECHLSRPDEHSGTFEHNGHLVHVVVSPKDCAQCHSTEAEQYKNNVMSHAHGNLADNPVYQQLQSAIIDRPSLNENGQLKLSPSLTSTQFETCYHCHGTRITPVGLKTQETVLGEMKFPILEGWPNQGVGRINTDGSKGSCSACHSRHTFSIAMARKPDTCKQCHVGPDVPATKVYEASKHGNIFAAMNGDWNFDTVPWTIGQDFTAPTCAACHISLLVSRDGEVVSKRTHAMGDRLAHRLYGLIYSHAHPKEPETSKIRNQDGLALPTTFKGVSAEQYLISKQEAEQRKINMLAACLNCHSSTWVTSHFNRLETTITESNATVKTATELMETIWQQKLARGLDQKANPFDEAIEKKWIKTWLFHANSIRFAAAMAGGGDYGVFADGRFQQAANIAEMMDWLKLRTKKLACHQKMMS
ncbi:MAG: multiheme c-type cytochrome, partial [Desulfobacteraceae bacterium]